ncbi:MAG TPA: hypothetical protein VFQ54_06730 [Thermomicrobiales bacterium]|nr:hypothetical protein [Thermomicrobiales bacterium]
MPWRQFWKREKQAESGQEAKSAPPATEPTPSVPASNLPPHMQRIVGERERPANRPPLNPAEKRARLQRQRLAILFDVDQGELAEQDDNPWSSRISLLTDALETVNVDRARLLRIAPSPYAPVPATPIADLTISETQPIAISFQIGPERFAYEEDLDWAERGHQLALPELHQKTGCVDAIIPQDFPNDLREPLAAHLSHSLDVFAADLRDRRLDDEPLPESPTLADIARPCPTCGGWTDWKGRCAACAARAADELQLNREQRRLLDERAREAEERHRLRDRLPLARKRLADVDAEIAALDE